MAKYVITAEQVNIMRIIVEADSFEEAQDVYYDGDFIEHDFERVGSEWDLLSIVDENGEEE